MTEQKPILSDREILKLCQTLARKYKSPQNYDDLVSEGVLVCYEILAQDPEPNEAQLWREANRRMRDYLNLDLHPLSVPNSDAVRSISRGNDVVEIDEFMAYSPDHADEYEKRDYEAYVMSVAVTCLDLKELKVLKERYYEGKSQEELGNELGVSKTTVSRWEDELLRKIRESLQ